ncbi:unnamed protein product [Mytilus edulis]|uniref:Reverse transcriptase RNase H-like domain-containing protein n=1 Tax=Mytilus edulis TaxID=6550 RepID=A0A8S3PP63_MYTED|nr:unnamed protein product [Mytilus edulis]
MAYSSIVTGRYKCDKENRLNNICKIIDRLKLAVLKLKPKKCTFFRHEIQFLGHIVSSNRVKTDPTKVEAVNYCVTRKELLAVVYFMKYFKHNLLVRKFTIRMDHGSLTWLYRFREPDGQISRLIQQKSAYDLKIVHRPGNKHSNADALSRIKIKEQDFCTQCKLPWDYEFEAPPKQDETKEPVVIAPVNKINTEVDNSFNVPIKRGSKPNSPKRAQAKKQSDITLTPFLIHEMQSQDTELGDVLKLKLYSAVKPKFENFTIKSTLFKNWVKKTGALNCSG